MENRLSMVKVNGGWLVCTNTLESSRVKNGQIGDFIWLFLRLGYDVFYPDAGWRAAG